MEIGWIDLIKDKDFVTGGGNAYRSYLFSLLSQRHCIEPMGVVFDKKHKIPSGLDNIYKLMKLKGKKDIWIRGYLSILTLPFDKTVGKNLLVIHHVDSDFLVYPTLCKFLDNIFYHNLKYVEYLVVVSDYWKKHFDSIGYNVKVVYNCFDFIEFNFTNDELIDFKDKYNLSEKPIVYIGNCQKSKGVVEAYDVLKNLDVHLITSGTKRVDIPAINLNLSYRDYLLLLKASSVVVTMSKFREGWCRTAHEAMLCKTPVVGSGLGGMKELLEGGGQIISEDFSHLKDNVEYLLNYPEIGRKGYKYASQEKFSVKYFENEWLKIISEIGR